MTETPKVNQFSQPQEATGATPAPWAPSDAIRLLSASRGCGCCSDGAIVDEMAPDDCPIEEWTDGDQDHTYEDGCNRKFDTLVSLVLGHGAPAGLPLHEATDRDGDNVPSGEEASCPGVCWRGPDPEDCRGGCMERRLNCPICGSGEVGDCICPPSDEERVRECAEAIDELISDHPMWIDDNGTELDYTCEREARISEFVDSAARACVAVEDRHTAALRHKVEEFAADSTDARTEAAELRAEVTRLRGALEASLLDAADWQESSEVMRDRLASMTRIARARGDRVAEAEDEVEELTAGFDRDQAALLLRAEKAEAEMDRNAADANAKAWDEGYRFGRLMQFDADWADKPKWPRHNSRKSLVANLDRAERGKSNHDNPYRATLRGPEPTEEP